MLTADAAAARLTTPTWKIERVTKGDPEAIEQTRKLGNAE
jgi:hypothetical protein